MSKIYIFSKNKLELQNHEQCFYLNKFQYLSLNKIKNNEYISIRENCCGYLKHLTILPFSLQSNIYYDAYCLKDNTFINFISLDCENIISEITTKNFNVKI